MEILLKTIQKNERDKVYYLEDLNGYTAKALIERGDFETRKLSEVISKVTTIKYGIKDLGEFYPYSINGIQGTANSFEELLGYVVYDYQTIQLGDSKYYSPNEVRIIEAIKKYQEGIEADLEMLKAKKNLTQEDVRNYSHTKIKHILNKKVLKNKGIFYVPALLAYTSTHLYNNYKKVKGNRIGRGCNYKRVRKYGSLIDIVPETLKLYDNTKVRFYYPYKIKGKQGFSKDKEGLYKAILDCKGIDFILVNERVYYSRQTKRNIKYLIKYINES